MIQGLSKDQTILDLLDDLCLQARGWVVVDHWDGDLCAVGVGVAHDPRRLVYVSTFSRDPGRYDYECEAPGGARVEDYGSVGTGENVDYDALVQAMEAHLS